MRAKRARTALPFALLLPLSLLLALSCGAKGDPPAPPASLPESLPKSAPTQAVKEPPRDPKVICRAPPRQASMFLTFTKVKGIDIEAPLPRGTGEVTGDKAAGPGTRALLFNIGKKKYGLRYSFPNQARFPVEVGARITLKRVSSRCTVGTKEGWRVEDEDGLVALVDAGGCAPAWPEEVLPGLTILPEDVGCEPKGEESFERTCALKMISPEGEALLEPGESREVSLAEGRFQVSAGLCALSLKDAALFKKTGRPRDKDAPPREGSPPSSRPSKKARKNADYRLSYAVLRIKE